MAEESGVGCSRPAGGPAGKSDHDQANEIQTMEKEEPVMIKVGKKAQEFTASGFYKADFVSIKLSDYLGKWVVLCFYPGDFTFV